MKTKLEAVLEAGRTAVTAEMLPPRRGDATAIRTLAAKLPASLDAVVVADSPHHGGGSALACAAVLAADKIEPILSMTTRDRSRIALNADVLGAAVLGVRSILCLGGEHQALGDCPQAAGAFDIDSIQFEQALTNLAHQGKDLIGNIVPDPPQFFIGAAAHPYLQPIELNLLKLRKKVLAGARFLLTQAVFDLAGFELWMEAVRAAGIEKQTAVIASVLPFASLEHARRMQARAIYGPVGEDVIARLEKAADPVRASIAICAETASKLKFVPGVRGIHILSGGCEDLAAAVVKEAGLASA